MSVNESGDVVLCGAEAASCRCVQPAGHDLGDNATPHGCDPAICTGQWTGEYGDEETFTAVRLPSPGPENPMADPMGDLFGASLLLDMFGITGGLDDDGT